MSKTDWKPNDLQGAGQYLVRSEKQFIQNTSYLTTIMVKVMYINQPERAYGLCSMADGWAYVGSIDGEGEDKEFNLFKDMLSLCAHMNSADEGQRFRPATQEEVMRVILHSKKRCFVDE